MRVPAVFPIVLVACAPFFAFAQAPHNAAPGARSAAGAASGTSAVNPAGKIAYEIAAKCRAAASYEFEGELKLYGQRGEKPANLLSDSKVRFAVSRPGKYRLELKPAGKDEYLLVSDGSKSWAYVPSLKQYTEDDAGGGGSANEPAEERDRPRYQDGGADSERDLAEEFSRGLVPQLASLAETTQAAGMAGQAQVKYGGKKYTWPVVRTMSKEAPDGSRDLMEITVDPATLRIGRLMWANIRFPSGVRTLVRLEMDFKSFRIGEPLPDGTFIFEPPAKATLVDAVPLPGQTGSFLVGRMAPDLELKTLDGEPVRLSDLRGHTVLLDFWASWCPPCREELPAIVKLYSEYRDKGLLVFGVDDEDKSVARSYSNKAGLNFPTLDDGSRKAHRAFRVHGIPSVFIIDARGKVTAFFAGARKYEHLREALRGAGL